MIAKRSALLILFIFLPATAFATVRYVVKKGDNLSGIAKRFRVSLKSIKKANRLSTDRLNVGDTIVISDSSENGGAVSKKTEKKENEKGLTESNLEGLSLRYVVKDVDTLSKVANQFGVTVAELKSANGLSDGDLKSGTILIIPDSRDKNVTDIITRDQLDTNPRGVSSYKYHEYVVKKGDSLGKIADRFGVSLSDLKSANGLLSNQVRTGMKLIIPDPSITMRVVRISTNVNEDNSYVVRKGDTLGTIASKYNLAIKDLKDANGLRSNQLKAGMKLNIPGSQIPMRVVKISPDANEDKSYTVRKGDTLGTIAGRHQVSLKDLKEANGLKSNQVRIGTRLTIPGSNLSRSAGSGTQEIKRNGIHIVKKGDSIGVIAKRYRVSLNDLKKANGLKGNTIRAGQVLRIPSQANGKGQLAIEDIKIMNENEHIKTLPKIETAQAQKGGNIDMDGYGLSRDVIISIAKRFLGAPYKFGGESLIRGLDCSAFVNKVFSFFDVDLPRTAREIYKIGRSVKKGELSVGDLVFFRTYASYPSHVGIYIGDSEFIHASSAAKRVRIDSINKSYYSRRYIGAKRVVSSGLFYEELSRDYKGFEHQ